MNEAPRVLGQPPTPAPRRASDVARTDRRAGPPVAAPSQAAGLKAKLLKLKGHFTGIAAVGAVLGGLVGYYNTFITVKHAALPSSTNATTAGLASGANASGVIHPLSVMVMPFANQTGDAQKAYVAEALTSSITGDLSRIQDAVVVPMATALSLQKKDLTIVQLGQMAAVRFVLTGSVTSNTSGAASGVAAAGEPLRISAVLSDTQTGALLWTANFAGSTSDLFALQDQVTIKIGNSIGPQMVIVAARESEKRKSTPQVADLLMQARALDLRQSTLPNHQAMEALFRQALKLEPDNVNATVGLAINLTLQAGQFADELKLDHAAVIDQFKKAANMTEKIRAIEPDNAAAIVPLQRYATMTGDLNTALLWARRTVELQPKNQRAYNSLGKVMNAMGDAHSAQAVLLSGLEFASAKRPPTESYFNLATAALILGQPDDCIAWEQKALEVIPGNAIHRMQLALCHGFKNDAAQAKKEGDQALRLNPKLSLRLQADTPWPGKEKEYREFIDTKLLPAARLAGIPP